MSVIAFRADGSKTIGAGHLMRCLCLAETLSQDGFRPFFITKNFDAGFLELIRSRKFDIEELPASLTLQEDLSRTLKAIASHKAEAVVVDSYAVDEAYLSAIKHSGVFLISIDDKAELKLPSDLVINPNLGVSASEYKEKGLETSKLLLGPSFSMLRKEFREKRAVRSLKKETKEVLISFGGSDTAALTQKVLNVLLKVPGDFHITAIGLEAGEVESKRLTAKKSACNMAELMTTADLAVLSAGTIAWEAACLGLPSVMVQVAENQQKNAEALDAEGIALNAGPAEEIQEIKLAERFQKLLNDKDIQEQMSVRGQKLVDGTGTVRILSEIKKRMIYEKN